MTPAYLLNLLAIPKLGAVKLGPEDCICIEFANRLRAWSLEGRMSCVWLHPANEVAGGTKLAALRYSIAKALGLISGAPDYVFLSSEGSFAIEMKAGKNGLSDNQKAFRTWCESQEIPYAVCRSADEAEFELRAWGLLK